MLQTGIFESKLVRGVFIYLGMIQQVAPITIRFPVTHSFFSSSTNALSHQSCMEMMHIRWLAYIGACVGAVRNLKIAFASELYSQSHSAIQVSLAHINSSWSSLFRFKREPASIPPIKANYNLQGHLFGTIMIPVPFENECTFQMFHNSPPSKRILLEAVMLRNPPTTETPVDGAGNSWLAITGTPQSLF